MIFIIKTGVKKMYKYIIYYDGGWLRDSSDMGFTYETEEAEHEAKVDVESYMKDWENENCQYDEDLFEIEVVEVWI